MPPKASPGTLCHLRVLATGGPFYLSSPRRTTNQKDRESEREQSGRVDRRFIYCYVNLTNEANEA